MYPLPLEILSDFAKLVVVSLLVGPLCHPETRADPFSLANWNRHFVDDDAQQAGASGTCLHSLYHDTACDTDGESTDGYGVLPPRKYFDILQQRQEAGRYR